MEDILEQLGYKRITENLWNHKEFGHIQLFPHNTIEDIAKFIHRQGYKKCQSDIKEILSIN
jgi:hypothetical protein